MGTRAAALLALSSGERWRLSYKVGVFTKTPAGVFTRPTTACTYSVCAFLKTLTLLESFQEKIHNYNSYKLYYNLMRVTIHSIDTYTSLPGRTAGK